MTPPKAGPDLFTFSSHLGWQYLKAIEEMIFFNQNQRKLLPLLREVIENYGSPHLAVVDREVRLSMEKCEKVQCLFAFTNQQPADLAGVAVYVRDDKMLKVLFTAIKAYECYTGSSRPCLVLLMLEKLKELAKAETGIESVEMFAGKRKLSFRLCGVGMRP
jgi:hypothetical protein